MNEQTKPAARSSRGEWPVPSKASPSIEGGRPLGHNGLLAALGPDAAASLTLVSRRISLLPGDVLWTAGESSTLVCFPVSGLVTSLSVDRDGVAAQVECTGPEGAVGLIEGVADVPHSFESRALVATDAWLVPVESVRRLMSSDVGAADIMRRHMAGLFDHARRSIACCARHSLRARLADCLLAYEERSQLSRLPLTQEMLSAVLGANRTTVTALMVTMSNEGMTRTGRGWVSIMDRQRLDHLACGCRRSTTRSKIYAEPRLAARPAL